MIKAIETVYNGYRFRSRLEARWAVFFDALGVKYEYEKEGFDLGCAGWYLPDFYIPNRDYWIEFKGPEPTGEEWSKCGHLASSQLKFVNLVRGNPWPNEYAIIVFRHRLPPRVVETWARRVVEDETDGSAYIFNLLHRDYHVSDELYEMYRERFFPLLPQPLRRLSRPYNDTGRGLFTVCPICDSLSISSVSYDGEQQIWIHNARCWSCEDADDWKYKEHSLDSFFRNEKLMTAYRTARQARFERGEKPIIGKSR